VEALRRLPFSKASCITVIILLQATAPTGSGIYSVVCKDLTSSRDVLYYRTYVRFSGAPAVGSFMTVYPMIANSSSVPLAYMQVNNDAGTLKWRLGYRTILQQRILSTVILLVSRLTLGII
jgi:hypothetical protein